MPLFYSHLSWIYYNFFPQLYISNTRCNAVAFIVQSNSSHVCIHFIHHLLFMRIYRVMYRLRLPIAVSATAAVFSVETPCHFGR